MNKTYNYLVIDAETTGLDFRKDEIRGVGVLDVEKGFSWYDNKEDFIKNVDLSNSIMIGHNIKFDLKMLIQHGYINEPPKIHDTLIMGHLIDNRGKHGLADLCQKYLYLKDKWKDETEEYVKEWKRKKSLRISDSAWRDMPIKMLKDRCKKDCEYTWDLFNTLKIKIIQGDFKFLYNVELGNLLAILKIEMSGIKIDKGYVENIIEEGKNDIEILKKEIINEVGDDININSNKQLAIRLHEKYRWTPKHKTETGEMKIDELELKRGGKYTTIFNTILCYRKLYKTINTYAKKFYKLINENDVLYCNFNQVGTTTGRYSSSKPNFQNITKDK